MKRFDFANEVAKQLITVSSAIITVVIAFYDKFFSHDAYTFILVFLVLFVFILSIISGVLCIGGLTNLVERQEYAEQKKAFDEKLNEPKAGQEAPSEAKTNPLDFIKLGKSSAQKCALLQQILFAFALVLFIGTAIYDRRAHEGPKPSLDEHSLRSEQPIVWTQVHPDSKGADGLLLARAIMGRGQECPDATIGASRLPMTARTLPSDPEFPRTICEVAYTGTEPATIADIKLPARPPNPSRILILGDTGCRITHYVAQECNNDDKWPLARIAESAARLKPHLIVHVGDYHYREKACADRAGCTSSPHGDNWPTWKAEFFDPARPLLTAAPWIMLRGNHEDCSRAGAGWQLLLRPERGMSERNCKSKTEAYQVDFRDLSMVVLDTADAESDQGRTQRIKDYQNESRAISARLDAGGGAKRNRWLLLHQPLWVSYGNCSEPEPLACVESDFFRAIDSNMRVAPDLKTQLSKRLESPIDVYRKWFEGALPHSDGGPDMLPPPNISLVLSGDTHMFQMFAPQRPNAARIPLQLVIGHGGDLLEKEDNFAKLLGRSGKNARLFGVEGRLWARREFGFALLTQDDDAWIATAYDVSGRARIRCNLASEECEDL